MAKFSMQNLPPAAANQGQPKQETRPVNWPFREYNGYCSWEEALDPFYDFGDTSEDVNPNEGSKS